MKLVDDLIAYLRYREVVPFLQPWPRSLLDLGCNRGDLARELRRRGWRGEYVGVDVSQDSAADVIHDLEQPLDLGRTFDAVVSLAVVEHLHDGRPLFVSAANHLTDQGRFLLTTPTPASKPVLETLAFLRIVNRDHIRDHKHYWTRAELEAAGRAAGLQLEHWHSFELGMNQLALFRRAG